MGHMAWAERLPNGLWRAVWRDDLGRKRSKSGIRSEAATRRFAGEQESRARRGDAIAAGRCPTWGEWLERWRRLRRVEASTVENDESRIRRHLLPQWGTVRLNKITRADVQIWVNELSETLAHSSSRQPDRETRAVSAGTVERIYNLFSSSMSAAALDDTVPLAISPCRGIELPIPGEGHERYLTRTEFDHIAHHLNEPYRTAACLLVGTGMRFGEFAGLHWQRVDMIAGRIDIVETWDPSSGTIKPYTKGKHRALGPDSHLAATGARQPDRPADHQTRRTAV